MYSQGLSLSNLSELTCYLLFTKVDVSVILCYNIEIQYPPVVPKGFNFFTKLCKLALWIESRFKILLSLWNCKEMVKKTYSNPKLCCTMLKVVYLIILYWFCNNLVWSDQLRTLKINSFYELIEKWLLPNRCF